MDSLGNSQIPCGFDQAILNLAQNEDWDWKNNYLKMEGTPKLTRRGYFGYGVEEYKELETVAFKLAQIVPESYHKLRENKYNLGVYFDNVLGRIWAITEQASSAKLSEKDKNYVATTRLITDMAREVLGVKHQSPINSELEKFVDTLKLARTQNSWSGWPLDSEEGATQLLRMTNFLSENVWVSDDKIKENPTLDQNCQKTFAWFNQLANDPYTVKEQAEKVQLLVSLSQLASTLRTAQTPFKTAILTLATTDWKWIQNYLRTDGYLPKLEPRSQLATHGENIDSALLRTAAHLARVTSQDSQTIRADMELRLAFQETLRRLDKVALDDEVRNCKESIQNLVKECQTLLSSSQNTPPPSLESAISEAQTLTKQLDALMRRLADGIKDEQANYIKNLVRLPNQQSDF